MIVLAIDTCLDVCAAALWEDGAVRAACSEPMQRGHQERLGGLVAAVLAEADTEPSAFDRIAVTVGPGSFTGVRVGLAFAKGLGLALGRPVAGVGVLEALAAGEPDDLVAAAVAGPREQVYLQLFSHGRPLMSPDCLPAEIAAARLAELAGGRPFALVGSGAEALAPAATGARIVVRAAPDIAVVARLAAETPEPIAPPRPLYLRAPDARPSAA
ncbi:MAG TPA: tRNA (adenosine(37)-N6)-threonylcarbamoyltransferase complex dimerization subunit type 1 TsaB [Caulobacteraceae bacterium]|nr:tRNA (adenosine(37)-N6)-threonylcarbamoyltransferase complex dimerization subunit type 1 TsaB [Caulobacteraceae bacterium]